MRQVSTGRRVGGKRNRPLVATLCGSFVVGAAMLLCASAAALAGGGNVQPPEAKPAGYSLEKMAAAMAYFDTSLNDPAYTPDVPFQILAINATNTFEVKTGTRFFVPVFFVDDSPPIIGDFPASSQDAGDYIFSPDEFGAHDVLIEVDGQATELGPDYVAGPVTAPDLLDGGGSHLIQVGAFLTPLSKGTHHVTISAMWDGAAILETYGMPIEFEVTYTVIVR